MSFQYTVEYPSWFDPEAYQAQQQKEAQVKQIRTGSVHQPESVPPRELGYGAGLGGRNRTDGKRRPDPFAGRIPNPFQIDSGQGHGDFFEGEWEKFSPIDLARLETCENAYGTLKQTLQAGQNIQTVEYQFRTAIKESASTSGNEDTISRPCHYPEEKTLRTRLGSELITQKTTIPLAPWTKRKPSRRIKAVSLSLGENGPELAMVLPLNDSSFGDELAARTARTIERIQTLQEIGGEHPIGLAREFNDLADSQQETVGWLRQTENTPSYPERTVILDILGTNLSAAVEVLQDKHYLFHPEQLTMPDHELELLSSNDPLHSIAKQFVEQAEPFARLLEEALRVGYPPSAHSLIEPPPTHSWDLRPWKIWRKILERGEKIPTLRTALEASGLEPTPENLISLQQKIMLAIDRRILRESNYLGWLRATAKLITEAPGVVEEPSKGNVYPIDYAQHRLWAASSFWRDLRGDPLSRSGQRRHLLLNP